MAHGVYSGSAAPGVASSSGRAIDTHRLLASPSTPTPPTLAIPAGGGLPRGPLGHAQRAPTQQHTNQARLGPIRVRRGGEGSEDAPSTSNRRPTDAPGPNPDLLFEGSRWRWPGMRERPPPASSPPPPPPPPPFPAGGGGTASGRRWPMGAAPPRPPPPPPPPPPRPPGSATTSGGPPSPGWAESLLRNDPELRDMLTNNPELWADLQRRAGKKAVVTKPPGPPEPTTNPEDYDRQVQEWLRYRREASGSGFGTQPASRQDDEIASLALLYLAAAVPLLAFALLSGNN